MHAIIVLQGIWLGDIEILPTLYYSHAIGKSPVIKATLLTPHLSSRRITLILNTWSGYKLCTKSAYNLPTINHFIQKFSLLLVTDYVSFQPCFPLGWLLCHVMSSTCLPPLPFSRSSPSEPAYYWFDCFPFASSPTMIHNTSYWNY